MVCCVYTTRHQRYRYTAEASALGREQTQYTLLTTYSSNFSVTSSKQTLLVCKYNTVDQLEEITQGQQPLTIGQESS